jgi:hypothetical protein
MPHYSDGTEAKVGDQVTGQFYNTTGVRAGTIISITPGAESCNAMVAFIEAVPISGDDIDAWEAMAAPGAWQGARVVSAWLGKTAQSFVPRMAVYRGPGDAPAPRFRIVRGEAHGSTGPAFALFECADYCAVRDLTKAP